MGARARSLPRAVRALQRHPGGSSASPPRAGAGGVGMSPPHPLHIMMTADTVGGVWIYATTLAKALCERGHRVSLVTLGPAPRADQVASVSAVPRLHVEITDLALEWMDPQAQDRERAARTLAALER